jgi:hypothetical protein
MKLALSHYFTKKWSNSGAWAVCMVATIALSTRAGPLGLHLLARDSAVVNKKAFKYSELKEFLCRVARRNKFFRFFFKKQGITLPPVSS